MAFIGINASFQALNFDEALRVAHNNAFSGLNSFCFSTSVILNEKDVKDSPESILCVSSVTNHQS